MYQPTGDTANLPNIENWSTLPEKKRVKKKENWSTLPNIEN
jgi:hypothetical protein